MSIVINSSINSTAGVESKNQMIELIATVQHLGYGKKLEIS